MRYISVIFLVFSLLAFSGCKVKMPTGDDYIKASAEFTCYVLEHPETGMDEEAAKKKTFEIFGKYNFPTGDDKLMDEYLTKFKGDPVVSKQAETEMDKCTDKFVNNIQNTK